MRKLLFLLLLPAFFTAKVVVSTEQDVELLQSNSMKLLVRPTVTITLTFQPIQMFMSKFQLIRA